MLYIAWEVLKYKRIIIHNIINLNPLVINYKNDYKYDELILNNRFIK